MKTITLLIDGKEKTFTVPFVSGLVWRKYIQFQTETADMQSLNLEEFDKFAGVVVLAFNNQFTLDEFLGGTPYDRIMSTVQGLFIPSKSSDSEGNEKK
ncbi:phage tail assembly chaperone G [Bacillus sp. AG4(2022)]|uniref:phage tail assembly chaperone G n=1 Tax=Bacillus sp. AG4(2022) TaxID=2962594 RepID=UPI0028823869|nr:hypothetical protein [Bacillus sp. AG4(2022)]MDT0163818.1 hypothetical protein [Bacillus sp. AG4(2022)]